MVGCGGEFLVFGFVVCWGGIAWVSVGLGLIGLVRMGFSSARLSEGMRRLMLSMWKRSSSGAWMMGRPVSSAMSWAQVSAFSGCLHVPTTMSGCVWVSAMVTKRSCWPFWMWPSIRRVMACCRCADALGFVLVRTTLWSCVLISIWNRAVAARWRVKPWSQASAPPPRRTVEASQRGGIGD